MTNIHEHSSSPHSDESVDRGETKQMPTADRPSPCQSQPDSRSPLPPAATITWIANALGEPVTPLPLWTAYTGQTAAEICHDGWLTVIHPDDRAGCYEAWQHALATKTLYERECRLRGVDGRYRDFIVCGVPVVRPDGAVAEWVGICWDITEQRQAALRQQVLIDSSALWMSLSEPKALLQAVAKVTVPAIADVCYVDLLMPHSQLERVAGYYADPDHQTRFEQLDGSRCQSQVPEVIAHCLATGRSQLVNQVDAGWLAQWSSHAVDRPFGEALELDSVLLVPLSVRCRPVGVLTVGRCRTRSPYTVADLRVVEELGQRVALAIEHAELNRTTQAVEHNLRQALIILGEHQQQLRMLQQFTDLINRCLSHLQGLLQVMVDAICAAMANAEFGVIALPNRETQQLELTALSGEGLTGTFEGDRWAMRVLEEVYRTGKPQIVQFPSYSLQPESPAALCAVAITSPQAGSLGVLAIGNWQATKPFESKVLERLSMFAEQAAVALTNANLINALAERETQLAIQNRLLAEQNQCLEQQQQQIWLQNLKLREAAQLKSQFVASVSHELRTPMNAIIGFSQLLLRQNKLPPSQRDMVRRILRNGRNLLDLVNDILDLSQLESGNLQLQPEFVDLPTTITTIVDAYRDLTTERKLSLKVEFDLTQPEVFHDPDRLRQIVANLLSNAIKFTPSGQIWVRVTEPTPDTIAIAIQDTGIGIAAADLEHIFETFRQVDQSLSKQFQGTGLGLAMTHLLVRLMQGHLTVASELGKGSTFCVELPRRSNQVP